MPGYLIGARLGVGSSGSVWRATALTGGPEVAIKVVRAGPGAEREVAVLRAVVHPHLVRLHQAVVLDDGRLGLVLDLVDGGTLASVVAQRGHLSPGEVITTLAPLAQTVADLHADGVQHGDLAPGNVLFDPAGRPVLGDLGTPRITGEPRDEVFGTAGYVDPVVLAGGRAGPPSDVYSLGALGWFALTGAPPESVALRVPLTELAPAAPGALVAAVESAVDPDPARRPEPGVLAAALLAAGEALPVWLSGAGPDAGGLTHRIRVLAAQAPAEPESRSRHRARRGRRPSLVVAAAVILAVSVVSLGWWLRPGWGGGRDVETAAPVSARAVRATPSATDRAVTSVASSGPAAATASGSTTPGDDAPSTSAAPSTPPTPPTRPPRPSSTATPVPPVAAILDAAGAAAVVASLTSRREQLFADPRRPVSQVAVAGSPAAAQDEAAVNVLRAQGLAYRGLGLQAVRVRLVEAVAGRAVVDLVTSSTSYTVVDRQGAEVGRVPADRGRHVRLVLGRTDQGWRVHAVVEG